MPCASLGNPDGVAPDSIAARVLLGNPDRVDPDSLARSVSSRGGVPTPCTRRRPFFTMRNITHSTRTKILTHSTRMSHIRNSVWPTFYLIRMSHSRNSVRPTSRFLRISHSRNSIRPTFPLLRIFHIRRLPLDGRGGRFNFPGQTCPDPSVTLIRRTSVANNSDSPDSLARQILAIRRIHFRPRCSSDSSVVHTRCASGSPTVRAQCMLDLSAIPTLSSWGFKPPNLQAFLAFRLDSHGCKAYP